MPTHLFSKFVLVGLGAGVAAYLYGKRHQAAGRSPIADKLDESDREAAAREPSVIPDSMDIDPADPVQGLDEVNEFHIEDLGVDAMSVADGENDQRIAQEQSTLDEASLELDTPADATMESVERAAHDVGDLYGVHTVPAVDRNHADDQAAFDQGQNWLEALETSATENGAEPERELSDIVDDAEIFDPPHASDHRDRPVADRGSGGPAGI